MLANPIFHSPPESLRFAFVSSQPSVLRLRSPVCSSVPWEQPAPGGRSALGSAECLPSLFSGENQQVPEPRAEGRTAQDPSRSQWLPSLGLSG